VPLVAEEFRPTLREELARRRPGTRRAIMAVLVLIALAYLVWVLKPQSTGERYIHHAAPVFNLRYGPGFTKLQPEHGEVLHLRRRPRGRDLDVFTVSRLTLPPYKGDVNGLLPVYAERVLTELRAAYPGLKLVDEGKARVNLVPGYSLLFRVGSGRNRMYGREILLPDPTPGARAGVRIGLRTYRGSGINQPDDLGAVGALKTPYRSFRFGTQGP
jgi:hypothetical protein